MSDEKFCVHGVYAQYCNDCRNFIQGIKYAAEQCEKWAEEAVRNKRQGQYDGYTFAALRLHKVANDYRGTPE